MSMLSPAISEHHKVQRVSEDAIPSNDPEVPHALNLALQPVPAKPHNNQKESEQIQQDAAQAEKKETDNDELPMPSFEITKPASLPALRGVDVPHNKDVPPALDLTHPNFVLNSSLCVEVRKSTLAGAGSGCFALCDIPNSTLLGEYKGNTFMTAGKVPNDGAYTWKVPACDDATTVLTREDTEAWARCGNRNGFVYVDAEDISEKALNPMRYVNGAWSQQQRMGVNVDAVINDRRVYYFTSKSVSKGDELMIDYGPQYWAKDSSPPPPSPPPPMLEAHSAQTSDAARMATKFEAEADDEAHSILENADKLGARLRAAREKTKASEATNDNDLWADEREADQGLMASNPAS